jgi:hypothetical protein
MDQTLIAALSLLLFFSAGAGYFIGVQERASRRRYEPTEHGERPL